MTSQSASNYLYLFVWRRYVAYLSSCLQTVCNSAMCELKCNTIIKIPTYYWHFIIYSELLLSPFSSNISCVRPRNASVLASIKNHGVTYQFTILGSSAGYTARKFRYKTPSLDVSEQKLEE